jgi:hypothetical protein
MSRPYSQLSGAEVEERMRILNDRLIAWEMCEQLEDVFTATMRRYRREVTEILANIDDDEDLYEQIHKAPFDLVLKSFDEALEDLDSLVEVTGDMW